MNLVYRAFELLFERYGRQYWWPGNSAWEICVGAVLTQNTNWHNVELAIENLRKIDALCPSRTLTMSEIELENAIRPSGFFRVKSKRLKNVAEWWLAHADKLKQLQPDKCDVSLWRQSLLDVNGIGEETADSILLYSFNLPTFVVDAYTRRTLARHFATPENSSYQTLQQLFMKNLPTNVSLYNEYHALLVKNAKENCCKNSCLPGCPLRELPKNLYQS